MGAHAPTALLFFAPLPSPNPIIQHSAGGSPADLAATPAAQQQPQPQTQTQKPPAARAAAAAGLARAAAGTLAAALGLAAGLALLAAGGYLLREPIKRFLEFFTSAVAEWGPWGYALYIAVYAFLEVSVQVAGRDEETGKEGQAVAVFRLAQHNASAPPPPKPTKHIPHLQNKHSFSRCPRSR